MKIIILDSIGSRDLVTDKTPHISKDEQGNITLDVTTNMFSANLQIILNPEDLLNLALTVGHLTVKGTHEV